MSIARELLTD